MILLIDNRDSFSWNLSHLIAEVWDVPEFRDADRALAELRQGLQPEAVILSPGPGRPSDHPQLLACLELVLGSVPVLGVCLGHQAIGERAGCRLVEAPRPVHGHPWPLLHRGQGLFAGLPPELSVMRYHSLTLDAKSLPAGLELDAWTADGCLMALRWPEKRAWGLQFHPESFLSSGGGQLIRAFRREATISRTGFGLASGD